VTAMCLDDSLGRIGSSGIICDTGSLCVCAQTPQDQRAFSPEKFLLAQRIGLCCSLWRGNCGAAEQTAHIVRRRRALQHRSCATLHYGLHIARDYAGSPRD